MKNLIFPVVASALSSAFAIYVAYPLYLTFINVADVLKLISN